MGKGKGRQETLEVFLRIVFEKGSGTVIVHNIC